MDMTCRPVIADGLICAAIGSGAELWAVRPDGHGVVTDTHVAWKNEAAVPRRSSVVLVDGLLYMVTDTGVAACIEARTGKRVWRERVGGNFSASLIHASDRVYFFDQEGKATVIKTGREYEVLAVNHLDDGLMASPAVSGNALFLRTPSHLYRIEE
jgi:outer membrane protein assembly factor BamB